MLAITHLLTNRSERRSWAQLTPDFALAPPRWRMPERGRGKRQVPTTQPQPARTGVQLPAPGVTQRFAEEHKFFLCPSSFRSQRPLLRLQADATQPGTFPRALSLLPPVTRPAQFFAGKETGERNTWFTLAWSVPL